jgi:hypothetical protein
MGRQGKVILRLLSVCGSIMVPVDGTGLLPLIFFFSPSPSGNSRAIPINVWEFSGFSEDSTPKRKRKRLNTHKYKGYSKE